MQVQLPAKLRVAIYIIVVMVTAVIVPLHVSGIVGDVLFNVWTSVSGAGSLLAAINVTTNSGAKQ